MKKVHNCGISVLINDWDEERDRSLLDRVNAVFQSGMDISIKEAFEKVADEGDFFQKERLMVMLPNAFPIIPIP